MGKTAHKAGRVAMNGLCTLSFGRPSRRTLCMLLLESFIARVCRCADLTCYHVLRE